MNDNWQEYIFTHLHRESYLWARQCCSYDDEHAKEVMQLVYLKLLEGKAKYHEKADVKTWLFSVIRFTAIDYLNKLPSHLSLEGVLELEENEPIDEKVDYRRILKQLPTRQHQVLLLVFYHGMKLYEVADILSVSVGSVRTHYDRGKKKLREMLTKERAV